MKLVLSLFAAVGMLFLMGSACRAENLNVGDMAPALTVKEFVKGKPVTAFESGKVYVVEFWATWCGPCIVSIPHVTELAKKNPDVTFVGVSVWETDSSMVKPFVTKMGDKMDYTVAMDDVPAGAKGNEGKMAKNWMTAAAQNGIPAAFIVNGEGKVAWIGHPMEMDKPLAAIVAGKWDLAKAAIDFKTESETQRAQMELSTKLMAKRADPKAQIAILDEAIAKNPAMEKTIGTVKFQLLRATGDTDGAVAYGKKLVSGVYAKEAGSLNSIAWSIVDPDSKMKATKSLCLVAKDAAVQADKLMMGKDAAIADTLAKALFDCGDVNGAIAAQTRAVVLAKGTPMEKDKSLQERLLQYRAANAKSL